MLLLTCRCSDAHSVARDELDVLKAGVCSSNCRLNVFSVMENTSNITHRNNAIRYHLGKAL